MRATQHAADEAERHVTEPQAPEVLREWPADRVERWPLDQIKPYPRNARLHSEEQVAQIAASMKRFGVTSPVLVDEEGVLIYGHGRRAAAELLGLEALPVSIARGWSEDEKKAYRITDNQLALNAEWDIPTLKLEAQELKLAGFDMPLLGFDDLKLVEFMAGVGDGGSSEGEKDRELADDEKTVLNAAWRRLLLEWHEIIKQSPKRGFASTENTKGALAVHFMRARLYGDEIPRAATLPYTGHRLFQVGDTEGRPYCELFKRATEDERVMQSLQWGLGGRPSLIKALQQTLAIQGFRYPPDFPATLARHLIDEFTPPGGEVLDPCHGWGGRMLGFLLSDASSYTGFDADPATTDGVAAMFTDLVEYAQGENKTAQLTGMPFEDVRLKKRFDFALTSPPYYDTEHYGGRDQSWKRYKTFDAWCDGFYGPMITKVLNALKPGGVFALQVGNQRYPLEQKAIELLPKGADHVGTRDAGMPNHQQQTSEDDGERIVLLRKSVGEQELAQRDPALQFGTVM